ncbi:MAG: hypothetical protein KJ579_03630 [Verrucomicrobia bacterium]|nr:hypothetical protein [Verrucomicrobiota bacterium]
MDLIDEYELGDGCSCAIAPGWGCNLFSWKVDGIELMYCPPNLPTAAFKITGGGNPILFPSVGRTYDHSSGEPVTGVYRIRGREGTCFMPSHGIVFLSHFAKVRDERSDGRIAVAYELGVPETVRAANYPFDLSMTQRFTMTPGRIELEAVIVNRSAGPAPCAFGYHPYFRISNPRREGVDVDLPFRKRLLLTEGTVLLTGESEDAGGVAALQPGVDYDHAFAGPTGSRMSLVDRQAGRALHVDFGPTFELFFLYSPAGSDFVCIEPWTRGLGAYEHLKEPSWERGEWIPVLQPGESVTHRAVFSVSTPAG